MLSTRISQVYSSIIVNLSITYFFDEIQSLHSLLVDIRCLKYKATWIQALPPRQFSSLFWHSNFYNSAKWNLSQNKFNGKFARTFQFVKSQTVFFKCVMCVHIYSLFLHKRNFSELETMLELSISFFHCPQFIVSVNKKILIVFSNQIWLQNCTNGYYYYHRL